MRKQHGDVIFERVNAIPEGAKQIELHKGFVVERGEGHHIHVLKNIDGVKGYEKDGVLYLALEKEIDLLDHEEHGVQIYQPGIYRKGIEIEYDAEADEARKTID